MTGPPNSGHPQPTRPLLDVVNSSGYPLQLAVADAIRASGTALRVVAEEHRWFDRATGVEGFADILLEEQHDQFPAKVMLLLECKRRKAERGALQFLVPAEQEQTRYSTVAFSEIGQGFAFWYSCQVGPPSFQALFTVGKDDGAQTRREVEAIGKDLALAAPCIAMDATHRDGSGEGVVVIPVLVTNSPLQVCRYNSRDLDLTTGNLNAAEYLEVPFVRVHRSFGGIGTYRKAGSAFDIRSQEAFRTLFVVSSAHIVEFVSRFEVTTAALNGVPWSWASNPFGRRKT